MVRSYGNIFVFLGFVCGIAQIHADEMSVKVVEAPAETPGMRALFNGKDLAGWTGDARLWSVRDGVIHGETTEDESTRGNTFLIFKGDSDTSEEFDDFELRLSFRCNATNNSGIQYRSEWLSDRKNNWVLAGYQHEVRNEIGFPNVSSFIYDEKGKGKRLCNIGEVCERNKQGEKTVTALLIDERQFQKLFHLDGWNDVVITAEGNRVRHFLNGRQVIDFVNLDAGTVREKGILGLQLHQGKPMWAEFKNIRIKN